MHVPRGHQLLKAPIGQASQQATTPAGWVNIHFITAIQVHMRGNNLLQTPLGQAHSKPLPQQSG